MRITAGVQDVRFLAWKQAGLVEKKFYENAEIINFPKFNKRTGNSFEQNTSNVSPVIDWSMKDKGRTGFLVTSYLNVFDSRFP